MKRFFIFIKMIFVYPTMFFSRLHSRHLDLADKHQISKIWANFIIRNAAVHLEVKNTNLIPLEDGYTFISKHGDKYDGLVILASQPLIFSFFIDLKERLPYMTAFLDLLESIRFNLETKEDDLILMSQGLIKKRNYHVFIHEDDQTDVSLLNAAYLSKTAIIPVAIKNVSALMKFGYQKITVAYCTPLHFEEYGLYSAEDTLKEIKNRLNTELKQGE